jgi:hypothetical protein
MGPVAEFEIHCEALPLVEVAASVPESTFEVAASVPESTFEVAASAPESTFEVETSSTTVPGRS